MIDKLLCFDNGFIKFEDNFLHICAAYKLDDAYLALLYDKFFCYEFSHHILINSPIKKLPCSCGIFDKFGKPVFLFGNSVALKEEFYCLHPQIELSSVDPIKDTTILENPVLENLVFEEDLQIEDDLKDDEIIDLLSKSDAPETYWQCNAQAFLEKLASGVEEKELSLLIPGSHWSKPSDEDYIMGVIFDENDEPMYLCYGFENIWSQNPPKDFEGYSQWIPKNFAEPHEEGYWVIYINAVTGERVK